MTQGNLHIERNPYQNNMDFLQRVGTNHLKISVESEKTPSSQGNIKKENQSRGITMLDVKLYYKAVVIKTVWSWHKNRHRDQWNRTENPEVDPQLYGQLIFDKAGNTIHWNKVSSINAAGNIGQPHTEE